MEEDFTKFVRGFSITAAGVFYSAVIFYAGALVTVNLLGPGEYGLFSLAFMVPSVAVFFLYFGLDITAARYIAHNLGEKNEEKALKCAQTIFCVRMGVAISSLAVFYLLSSPLSRLLGEDIATGLRWLSLYMGLFLVMRYLMGVLQGYFFIKERTITEMAANTLYMALVIPLVYYGFGYTAPIFSLIIAIVLTIIMCVYYLKRSHIAVFALKFEGFSALKEYLQFSFYVYVSDSFHTAYVWIGTLVIALYSMPVEAVGYYRAMFSVTNTILIISYGLTIVLYPMLSELNARKEYERLSYGLCKVITYTVALSVPAAFGMFLVSRSLIVVLFPKYVAAIALLRIFSFKMIFLPLWSVLATSLLILDRAKEQAVFSVFLCCLNFVLSLILGSFSVEGIALANTMALAVAVILQYRILRKRIPSVNAGPVGKFCLSALVMGAVVWGVIQLQVADVGKVVLSLVGGVVVYGVMVLRTHAVSRADLEMMQTGLAAFGRVGKSLEPFFDFAKMIGE